MVPLLLVQVGCVKFAVGFTGGVHAHVIPVENVLIQLTTGVLDVVVVLISASISICSTHPETVNTITLLL